MTYLNKKICFIVTDALSLNTLSLDQIKTINSLSNVDVTAISGGNKSEVDKYLGENLGFFKYISMQREPSLIKDLVCLIKLWWFLIFNRFDLIVYSTPKALLLGSLASFFSFHQKRISILRGRPYENFIGIKRRAFLLLDIIACKLSTINLVISESLRDAYLNDKVDLPERLIVLAKGSSNGVDTSKFDGVGNSDNIATFKSEIAYQQSDFIVSIIGRVCRDKGAKELVQVISHSVIKANNLKFIIVGHIEDNLGKELIELKSEFPNKVFYFSHRKDVPSIFAISNIHLFLTHREGFGNVAIEAASSGVPTLSYDVVGVRDSVENGVSGKRFTGNNSLSDIQTEILFAVQNSNNYKNSYPNIREWAVINFERKKVRQDYINFYMDLIND
jgi:glycosyltransferase involved in cell wall biosynthesis